MMAQKNGNKRYEKRIQNFFVQKIFSTLNFRKTSIFGHINLVSPKDLIGVGVLGKFLNLPADQNLSKNLAGFSKNGS